MLLILLSFVFNWPVSVQSSRSKHFCTAPESQKSHNGVDAVEVTPCCFRSSDVEPDFYRPALSALRVAQQTASKQEINRKTKRKKLKS